MTAMCALLAFRENGLRTMPAATAAGTDAKLDRQVIDGCSTARGSDADVALGDSVADADVHDG